MLEALFSKINKSEIVRRKKERGVECSFDYMEDFDEESQFNRKIFELPSEPIWYYTLLILGLYNMCYAIFMAMQGMTGPEPAPVIWPNEIFYLCDILWCFDMVLCILSPYVLNLRTSLMGPPGKKLWMYILQLLSLLPFEVGFYKMPVVFHYIVLNRALKIGHVIYMFSYINSLICAGFLQKFVQLLYLLIYMMMVLTFLFLLVVCSMLEPWRCLRVINVDDYYEFATYGMMHIADHVTMRGFGITEKQMTLLKILLIVGGYVVFIGIFCLFTAMITFTFFARALHMNNFRYQLNSVKIYLDRMELPDAFISVVEKFFDNMWVVCHGYLGYMGETNQDYGFKRFMKILPKALQGELHADICWGAFSHSLLFKDMPMPFLRILSSITKQQIYIEGQYIYHMHGQRNRMIYIASGIVQVMSQEDGETPLVNLADGSVIGETCVLLPRLVVYKIKCLTTCVVQELKWMDFMQVANKYPVEYNQLMRMVRERYADAQTLHGVKQLVNNKDGEVVKTCLSTMWVNHMLHELMGAKDFDSAINHSVQSIYLAKTLNDNTFKNYLFSANYLQLLTTNERIQTYRDTLFIRATFPHILKPNTGLTLGWNVIVALMALIAGVRIPICTMVFVERNSEFWCTIYAFTIIWWLDIIIQFRTAVQLRHRLATKFTEIFVLRITSLSFAFDLLSAFPVELCSAILVTEENENMVFFNRSFKIVRVFQLLHYWEKRYDSNPIVVRFFTISLVSIYTSIISACILYRVECLNDCGTMEFIRLLFMTTQIISGISMWVNGYCLLKSYRLYLIIMYIAAFIMGSTMFGLLFSAHAFNKMHTLNMESITFEFIRVVKMVDDRLIDRIEEYVRTQREISRGLHFMDITYLFDVLPRPLIGYMFEQTHLHWIKDLPLFNGLPEYVVTDILQRGAYIIHIPPATNIFHVGDVAKEYVILSRGMIEKISGMTYASTVLKTRQILNDLEVTLKIPSRNVLLAQTYCELIVVPHLKMLRILVRHGFLSLGSLRGMRGLRQQILTHEMLNIRTNNFRFRPNDIPETSAILHKTDPNYYINMGESKYLRFLLMYYTFLPNGTFFYYWELARSVSVVIITFMYSTTSLPYLPILHPVRLFLIIYDVYSLLDIYVQMHVCYYNENGILITHPIWTAKNYISKRLLLDVLGMLPAYLIIQNNNYIIFNINRMLQLRRYLGFLNYNSSKTDLPKAQLYIFKPLPILFIILNFMVSYLVNMCCDIDTSIPQFYENAVNCSKTSVFSLNIMEVTFTPLITHLYGYYILLSAITSTGIQGFSVEDTPGMIAVCFVSALAFYYETLSTSRYFSHYMNKYKSLFYNELHMHHLMTFFHREKVRPTLVAHARQHLKKWWRMSNFNVHAKMKQFPVHIQRDVLFERFGTILMKCCLGRPRDFEMFIRNLLVHTTYSIVDKNGFLLTINDVTDQTIILFSGVVEIVAPHGAVLCLLRPGSIIGNLCRLRYNRMFESVIALGTCELLSLKTTKFYELLDHFPETRDKFLELRFIHATHIPGYSKYQYTKIESTKQYFGKYTIDSRVLTSVSFFLLITGTYISILCYVVSIAVAQLSLPASIVAIFTDVCFIGAIYRDYYKELRTVFTIGKYTRSSRMNKRLFWLAVFSLLPVFHVMNFVTLASPYAHHYIYVGLRLPVLIRYHYFHKSYIEQTNHTRITMFTKRFVIIILNNILMLVTVACVFMLSMNFFEHSVHSVSKHVHSVTATDGLILMDSFVEEFYVIVKIFMRSSQHMNFPVTLPHVLFFICVMVFLTIYRCIFFAKIVSVVQTAKNLSWHYLITINHLYSFLNCFEVSLSLMERVTYYVGVVWVKMNGLKYPKLMKDIPLYLREAIIYNMLYDIIALHPILAKCHPDLKRQLSTILKFEYYYHGDYIQYKGVVDNTMYWVHDGIVVSLSEVSPYRDDVVAAFHKGNSFGIPQGVFTIPHIFSYRAITATCIISLAREDFEHLLPFFPASRGVIQVEAHKLRLRQNKLWRKLQVAEEQAMDSRKRPHYGADHYNKSEQRKKKKNIFHEQLHGKAEDTDEKRDDSMVFDTEATDTDSF